MSLLEATHTHRVLLRILRSFSILPENEIVTFAVIFKIFNAFFSSSTMGLIIVLLSLMWLSRKLETVGFRIKLISYLRALE